MRFLYEPLNPPFQIPDSWTWVRLNEISTIVGGGTPKTEIQDYWDGNIPWVTPADMKNIRGKYIGGGSRNITELGLHNSSAQLLPIGSIVYSSRAPIGYIAITTNRLSTNQGFRSVVPYSSIYVEYLYYALKSRLADIKSRATGTTFLEISGTELGKTFVPLPPEKEQNRIVVLVDKLFSLIEQLEKNINKPL